jgi:hypothetical protein
VKPSAFHPLSRPPSPRPSRTWLGRRTRRPRPTPAPWRSAPPARCAARRPASTRCALVERGRNLQQGFSRLSWAGSCCSLLPLHTLSPPSSHHPAVDRGLPKRPQRDQVGRRAHPDGRHLRPGHRAADHGRGHEVRGGQRPCWRLSGAGVEAIECTGLPSASPKVFGCVIVSAAKQC